MPDRRPHLDWPGFLNFRDLGGHRTKDRRQTQWRVVVRSDMPRSLGAATRSAVLSYGIRSVLDLRLPEQAARNPNPFALSSDSNVSLHSLPFAGPIDSGLPEFGSLELQYRNMLLRVLSSGAGRHGRDRHHPGSGLDPL